MIYSLCVNYDQIVMLWFVIIILEVIFEKQLNLVVSYTETKMGCVAQVLCVGFATKIDKSELCARLSFVCNSWPNLLFFHKKLQVVPKNSQIWSWITHKRK